MKNKDSLLSFGFDEESGTNIAVVTLNPESELMCPECFEPYHIKHDGYIRAELYSGGDHKEMVDLNFAPKIEYVCLCRSCRKIVSLVQIDTDLLPAIRILNKGGWKTESCCQGHSNEIMKRMFIKFQDQVVLPSTPIGWTFDKEGNAIETKYSTDDQRQEVVNSLYFWIGTITDLGKM